MSLTIKTNIASLIAQSSLTKSTNKLNQAIERMSTGSKINHASDNAANYSISTNMTTKINAYQVAEDNVSMGLDLVQTASSTLESMGDLTTRLRALATQAQNGTYGNQSINALTKEANAIVSEINRLQTTAEYNGIKLFTGTSGGSLTLVEGGSQANSSSDIGLQALVSASENANVTGATSSKFISPVVRRDTSSMTKLADVDENTELTSGTYSISTAEELAKLATMTNNGKIGANTEFVLANDIDLSVYSNNAGWTPIGYGSPFKAKFDGNGYVISDLYIDSQSSGALFGDVGKVCISNLGLENVNITCEGSAGGLIVNTDYAETAEISNCYVTGSIKGYYSIGGLVASSANSNVKDCYVMGNITGMCTYDGIGHCVGGLIGQVYSTTSISDSYSKANITGIARVSGSFTGTGGLIGANQGTLSISSSYSTGAVKIKYEGCEGDPYSLSGGLIGHSFESTTLFLDNAYFTDTTGQLEGLGMFDPLTTGQQSGTPTSGSAVRISMKELDELIAQNVLPPYYKTPSTAGDMSLTLQVGINANESSQIGLTIQGIDLSALNNLDLQSDTIFETLDSILAKINDQQTSLGAVQNRLMSALDEISTQYENLVSSRSTLRDADIADVSSEYIKMQILQNASATLLATANQSPALALQLL